MEFFPSSIDIFLLISMSKVEHRLVREHSESLWFQTSLDVIVVYIELGERLFHECHPPSIVLRLPATERSRMVSRMCDDRQSGVNVDSNEVTAIVPIESEDASRVPVLVPVDLLDVDLDLVRLFSQGSSRRQKPTATDHLLVHALGVWVLRITVEFGFPLIVNLRGSHPLVHLSHEPQVWIIGQKVGPVESVLVVSERRVIVSLSRLVDTLEFSQRVFCRLQPFDVCFTRVRNQLGLVVHRRLEDLARMHCSDQESHSKTDAFH